MINTDLKILILTQRINHNLHIILVLVKRDKFLKFFCCLLRKISLQNIWKTIWDLKFTCDNFSYQDFSSNMDLIDAFELLWLEAFLGERHNIKLEVKPHVLNNQAHGYSAVQGVPMNIVLHIDVWSTTVKNHAASNSLSVRVSDF